LSSRAGLKGCLSTAILIIAFLAAVSIAFFVVSAGRDPDSPLARMYRTEADLTALKKALSIYHEEFHAYPPGGPNGLRLATDFMSRKGRYLPGGPPPDAWNRPYTYLPAPEYAANKDAAITNGNDYFAADSYQLYSCGGDGDPGSTDTHAHADNIVSWDESKAWRQVYGASQANWTKSRPH